MSADPGQGLPEGVIELERRIAAPPETVFAYFVDPDRYLMWQGIAAELDPRPGGVFRVTQNDSGYIARGEYLEVDPPKRVVFSWGWVQADWLPDGMRLPPGICEKSSAWKNNTHWKRSGLESRTKCMMTSAPA